MENNFDFKIIFKNLFNIIRILEITNIKKKKSLSTLEIKQYLHWLWLSYIYFRFQSNKKYFDILTIKTE